MPEQASELNSNPSLSNDIAQELPPRRYNDFSAFRTGDMLDSWQDIIPDYFNLPYGQFLMRLYKHFLVLPDESIQLPIMTAFACQNSAVLNYVGNLFFWGKSGSGKSTGAKLISATTGVWQEKNIQLQGSSVTGLRNKMQEVRYYDSNGIYEKPVFLIWEDLHPNIILEDKMYSLMKAHERGTAYIEIASKDRPGENDRFFVFCPKVMSSIHPVFTDSDFSEFSRRTFFIACQKVDEIEGKGEELATFEDYDWDGLDRLFEEAWNPTVRDKFKRAKQSLKKPKDLTMLQWQITKELIVCGLTCDVWSTHKEAIECTLAYWGKHERKTKNVKSPVLAFLEGLVNEMSKPLPGQSEKLEPPRVIDPDLIRTHLDLANKRGELDEIPSPKIRSKSMNQLGYTLRFIPMERKNYFIRED